MNDEFIEPSKRGVVYALLGWLSYVGLLAFLAFWLRPLLLTAPACEKIATGNVVLLLMYGLIVVAGIWVAFTAAKVLKYKQSPPPGTHVWRRTPIRRGPAVMLKAAVMLFCSLTVTVLPYGSWDALDRSMQELAVKSNCPSAR